MNADLSFNIINHTTVQLQCESWLVRELDEKFTFFVDGYKFMPKYKMGIWDGKIRLIDTKFNTTLVGLIPDILVYCKEQGYSVELTHAVKSLFTSDFSDADCHEYIEKCNLPFEPRDYQFEAVRSAIRNKRLAILSATGSGKSLIIYLIARYMAECGLKTLLIVPTVSLVNQMHSDFTTYAENSPFDVDANCHKIFSGQDKETDKPIVISTWQSLQKLPEKYFQQYDAVIGDEVHQYDAAVCSRILRCCTNASVRIGLTGTLDDSKVSELQIKGLFGSVRQFTSTRELMDQNVLADLHIRAVVLRHDPAFFKNIDKTKYHDEISYIVENKARNHFLAKLNNKTVGNTLILFNFVEKQGKPLYEILQRECPDREVYLVYGGTDADMREHVRKLVETKRNITILASYGVFSTGVNAVNLDNVIFASPTKSKIRVLQSLGRGLRRGADKDFCTLFDIADDLTGGTKNKNHTLKHFHKRFEIYQTQGFDVSIHVVDLK